MRSAAIIGYTGKGSFNTPTKLESVKDLHTQFGKKSNVVAVAEQLIYSEYNPYVVRIEDFSETAKAMVLDDFGQTCMTIVADSPGSVGCKTTIEVTRDNSSFTIIVSNGGEMVEFWGFLTPSTAEENINLASKWITVSMSSKYFPRSGKFDLKMETKKRQALDLRAIMNAVKATEGLDVEFLSIPDCDNEEFINEVLVYLETERPDVMLVVDPPWECDLLQTYKWCKELIPSDQGVIFWPWLNYERKSVPPSGPVLAAVLGWPFVWKPVRTKLAGVSDAAFSIHHDELAYLSKQEHFINLTTKKNDLLVVDARILTLAGSKFSERRLLNYIKNRISTLGKDLLRAYDPISGNFKHNFIESSEYILQPIKDDQGINNYLIQVNEFCKPGEFEVNVELAIRDSAEIVNICFKFTM